MRLTADGRFHLCLLHDDEIDLRAALRGEGPPGAERARPANIDAGPSSDRESAVRALLERAIAAKPTGHALSEGIHPTRRMHTLGG